MHIIIGLGAALALLYFWLIGHWFARVVMFLILMLTLGLLGGGLFASGFDRNTQADAQHLAMIFGAILGAASAWPVSGIPIYYWRKRFGIA